MPNDAILSQRGLMRLMLKMPALRGQLQLLSARNDDVRSLLGAFEEASVTLEGIRKGNSRASPDALLEYESLCAEIENDIIDLCRNIR